ncbi:MAG: xanthine dehydrogenase family protein subunit M, partial [Alphaproteobacteria bacterium]|nr:xanthine dehydrogenase family protein subunit M [Alphaproteobacteria bacterium]
SPAAALVAKRLDDAAIAAAVRGVADEIAPEDDQHASAAYRKRVAPKLLARAIADAARAVR